MKKVSLGLVLATLFSCGSVTNRSKGKSYFADLLKDVDKVRLIYFNHGDTLSETITGLQEIDIYKELINGKRDPKQKIKCDSTGQIQFLHKETILLNAWFSSPASGSKLEKPCVSYSVDSDHYGSPLTYRSGRNIDDYYYKLRSIAIRVAEYRSKK
jgi:hypothetical protein